MDKLAILPQPAPIQDPQGLEQMANITIAIQETISEKITSSKPHLDAKRWWNKELTIARKVYPGKKTITKKIVASTDLL